MIQCFGRILQVPLVIGYRRTSICLVFYSSFHNFYSQCSKQMIPGLLRLANFLWRSQSPISVCCLAGFIAHYCLILDFFAGNLETLSMSSYREGIGSLLSTEFLIFSESWWSSIVFLLSLYKREASLLSTSPKCQYLSGFSHQKKSLTFPMFWLHNFSASFDQSFSISKQSFFF